MAGFLKPVIPAQASPSLGRSAQTSKVTAFDLIIAMNTLRVSYGLPALVEDPIINAVAQGTAETMAANQMSSHIGNVRGRLAAAGYGGGSQVWATENFAVGNYSIDEIMQIWSDEAHMLPAVIAAYCNVGAGVATSANGRTYYVLQAAYTAAKACGEYKSPGGGITLPPGGSTGVSQVVVPVKIATPDADGRIYHVVQPGQSFWSIAIAYKITIRDIETWNNLSRESKLLIGQRLFIPSSNTEGYATPTPVGLILTSTPDADGKIVHTVQAYQTLTTIAQAYGVTIGDILARNNIQVETPLQIGQALVIHPGSATPSPTPRPLTPIERLTPESDGKYYHTVSSGETLVWIAGYYGVPLADLMAWNGLTISSIIRPDQKLLLQVTPPATETSTPGPPTLTATATRPPSTPTASISPPPPTASPTAAPEAPAPDPGSVVVWLLIIGFGVGGVLLVFGFARKRS